MTTHNHMPDRALADLMRRYELNGSLKNGRDFMDAVMVYFLGPQRTREILEGAAVDIESQGGSNV